jgi:hypothetical protein
MREDSCHPALVPHETATLELTQCVHILIRLARACARLFSCDAGKALQRLSCPFCTLLLRLLTACAGRQFDGA